MVTILLSSATIYYMVTILLSSALFDVGGYIPLVQLQLCTYLHC
jgi:hypothetical protein